MNDNTHLITNSALDQRKRLLIATALFEYVLNEEGKPLELQSPNNIEEIRELLETDYADMYEVITLKKAYAHKNLRKNITPIDD